MSFLSRLRHVHCIGIGGAGLSSIAAVLQQWGHSVTGSDLVESVDSMALRQQSIPVLIGHAAAHIGCAELVIYSGVIAEDNPEYQAAFQRGIPLISRASMLAEIANSRYAIAVTGSHGKTTTSSMLASLFKQADLNPTVIIGGRMKASTDAALAGSGTHCIVELDESEPSFLQLKPKIAVLLNLSQDHLKAYDDCFTQLCESIQQFLLNIPQDGLAVLCYDDPIIRQLIPALTSPYVTYGFSAQADYSIERMIQSADCASRFWLRTPQKALIEYQLPLPGRHNVLNAVAACCVAQHQQIQPSSIQQSLSTFSGIHRRFEYYGAHRCAGHDCLLLEDYGHHPREISATLDTVRACWPDRPICMIFQPHRYSRTRDLFNHFVEILSAVDQVALMEIHAASEKPIAGVNSQVLCQAVAQHSVVQPRMIAPDDHVSVLASWIQPDALVLMQGAGSAVRKFAKQFRTIYSMADIREDSVC